MCFFFFWSSSCSFVLDWPFQMSFRSVQERSLGTRWKCSVLAAEPPRWDSSRVGALVWCSPLVWLWSGGRLLVGSDTTSCSGTSQSGRGATRLSSGSQHFPMTAVSLCQVRLESWPCQATVSARGSWKEQWTSRNWCSEEISWKAGTKPVWRAQS